MKVFLMVLLGIFAFFWLLGRLRLGGVVQYDADGLMAQVIIGPRRVTLFPPRQLTEEEKAKKAKAKAKREAKKARKEEAWRKKHPGEEPPQEKKGGALPPVTKLLPLVGDAAGGLKKRIRIDELTLRLTWASSDPVETALGYGRANAALNVIWPVIANNFNVKQHDLAVGVDFVSAEPVIFCRAALTLRLGQLFSFGLRLGLLFLRILAQSRSESNAEVRMK